MSKRQEDLLDLAYRASEVAILLASWGLRAHAWQVWLAVAEVLGLAVRECEGDESKD